jgi:DNA-binding NarL/FixJ family response regulator
VQRDEIRRRIADGETVLALAAEFGVSVRTIRNHT